jgi:S1-C subfamily serine protease
MAKAGVCRIGRAGLGAICCLLLATAQLAPAFAQSEAIASGIASQYSTATIFLAVEGTTVDGQKEKNFGTGFFISGNGYLLTAAHVVLDSRKNRFQNITARGSIGAPFDLQAPSGFILPIELVRLNTDIDVALLKAPIIAPVQGYNAVHFCRTANIPQGARLHSLGFPLQQPLSVNSGTLSNKDGPRGLWKTDTLVNEGSSGGPVFDNTGHVVGIVKGGIQEAPGNNFIIPVTLMLDIVGGIASLDDCQLDPAVQQSSCVATIKTYEVNLIKADSPNFREDKRMFTQVFPAIAGYTIESADWRPAIVEKASEPQITISADKSNVRFQTEITSGPFHDPFVGRVTGMLITTQKPKCK